MKLVGQIFMIALALACAGFYLAAMFAGAMFEAVVERGRMCIRYFWR